MTQAAPSGRGPALDAVFQPVQTPTTFEVYRRADVRFHIGLAEACHSPRLVAAMTEVQGQMSDLIERVAHPDEVLTHSNAQHKRLVTLLRRHDTGRAVGSCASTARAPSTSSPR